VISWVWFNRKGSLLTVVPEGEALVSRHTSNLEQDQGLSRFHVAIVVTTGIIVVSGLAAAALSATRVIVAVVRNTSCRRTACFNNGDLGETVIVRRRVKGLALVAMLAGGAVRVLGGEAGGGKNGDKGQELHFEGGNGKLELRNE
jgi:uncharacterized membrane protein YgcG